MNAKLLFAATVALSIASSYAMADETAQPLTRAQVVSDLHQAAANGTLRRTDYDDALTQAPAGPGEPRSAVVADLAAERSAPKPVGPLGNNRYNQNSSELLQPSLVARSQVKTDLQQAIASGTLQRTDYDADSQLVARRANAHEAGLQFMARLRGGSQPGAASQTRIGE